VISDCVSLPDKLGTFVAGRRFVSEHGALDPVLLWLSVVDVLSPNKERIGVSSAERDDLSGADELTSRPAVRVSVAAVVTLIEFQARLVAIPCQIPKRAHSFRRPVRECGR
jgi:hypothetical protein